MLRVVDRFGSGNSAVDLGVIEMSVVAGPAGTRLIAYSGTNGGVATYEVNAGGRLTPIATRAVSTAHGLLAETDMAVAFLGSTTAILVGIAVTGGLTGWVSSLSGGVGRPYALTLPAGFGGRMLIADQPDATAPFYVLSPATGRIAVFDPARAAMTELTGAGSALSGSHSLVQVQSAGHRMLLSVDSTRTTLTAHRHDPATNSLTRTSALSAADGLAVAALSALDVVQMAGQTFVIAAAAGTSSLTVIRLSAQGQLSITDHVLDSRDTRFEAVRAIDTINVGGQVFVVAGGGDDGVTLFRLLPDGTLQALATIEDSLATGLANVTAVKIIDMGNRLYIYVGGETESGLTVLEWSLGTMGAVIDGTGRGASVTGTAGADILSSGAPGQALSGGGGDDVLIANTTGTRLTGGSGSDIFVLRSAATQTTITDFQRGADGLDLTGWPMLRDIGQLVVTPRSDGVTVTFNGRSVTIHSADGRPLTLADILPGGIGPARIPLATLTAAAAGGSPHGQGDGAISPGTPIPPGGTGGGSTGGTTGGSAGGSAGGGAGGGGTAAPPYMPSAPLERPRLPDWSTDPAWANGSTRRLELVGTDGNDTLTGASGRDFLQGGPGDDLFYTGFGADTVFAGAGNDTIFAAGGNNELWGGPGNDMIRARYGDDYIGGGSGDDLIDGGGGQDTMWGGAGNDTIMGGGKDDMIGGGAGNDQLYGYAGDDLIFGGLNDDTIHGGTGNDTIWGGSGNDLIAGGAGDDVIAAGAGTDHIWGGAGADTFLFYRHYGTTYIRDFNAAEGDQIHLVRWMFDGAPPSGTQIVQQYGRLTTDGAILDLGAVNTLIHVPGVSDLAILADHISVI